MSLTFLGGREVGEMGKEGRELVIGGLLSRESVVLVVHY